MNFESLLMTKTVAITLFAAAFLALMIPTVEANHGEPVDPSCGSSIEVVDPTTNRCVSRADCEFGVDDTTNPSHCNSTPVGDDVEDEEDDDRDDASIKWNIGETQWLEASYPASGTGVVRVIDPDMNLDPEAVDNFDIDVWSDSDPEGIELTVTETNEASGIFEGTVSFTTTDESSGQRLSVLEGDTITAKYEDNTLPDSFTTADELDITGTSIIGT